MLSKEEMLRAYERANWCIAQNKCKQEKCPYFKECVGSNLTIIMQYIEQLETNNKKLIEKLEEDMSKYKWALNEYGCTISDYKQSQAVGAWIALQEILKIAKGEKE